LSAAQARRIALAAQGFGGPAPAAGTRQLNATLRRLAALQLDSVNVFERSHYLPIFARLGAYDKATLDRLTFGNRSDYTESWAHQAAIIPVESWALWRWAMRERQATTNYWSKWAAGHGDMLAFLRAELRDKGPLTARQVEHDANVRRGPWWGWSDVKTGLETLFMFGEVVTAGRERFERRYDLAERRLPASVLSRDIPKPDAVRELVRVATQALGVGTLRDITDYFRLMQDVTKTALNELVESGEVVPVTVEGWGRPAFMHRDARVPRRIEGTALLSPFDPIVWERERALRMFGFHYRIEIYTPAPKRVFGYYTMPLLIDEALVGRIDLKSDRQARVLRVQSAWREPGHEVDLDRTAELLKRTAAWQGMEGIEVTDRGDLAGELKLALG
jgi:uncharacterized protein YcaQ